MSAAPHGFDGGLATPEGVAHEDWPVSCRTCFAMRESNNNMRLCANRFGRSYGLHPTMTPTKNIRVVFALVLILVVVCFAGCRQKRESTAAYWHENSTEMKEFVQQTDKLCVAYRNAYLTNNYDQAKQCLEQIIQLVESAKLEPQGAAHDRFMGYCRLYVLEHRAWKDDSAEFYLVEARYWLLKELYFHESEEVAGQNLKAFTSEKMVELVDKADHVTSSTVAGKTVYKQSDGNQ